jgi:hypothetical protein
MDLATLLAERAIYRQLIGFSRAMDERDWPTLTELVCEDIKADVGVGETAGSEAFLAVMRSFLDDCGVTQHLLGNVLIEVTGDCASSRAYVSDMHLGVGAKAELTFRTLGDYHDEWVCRQGIWLMSRRKKLNRATLGSFDVFSRKV